MVAMTEPGELSFEKQEALNKDKVVQRREDATYLREHPELTLMINSFLRTVLEESPEDPLTFAQDFFCQKNLQKHILRIEDDGDSSSSGDEVDVEVEEDEKDERRKRVQMMMKQKRAQIVRRRRRELEATPVMDLGCESDSDEEPEGASKHDPKYGLSDGRVAQLIKLFTLVDRDQSGAIDSYELSLFAKAFFRALSDTKAREEAEMMMEEIDIDGNGRIDREEYLSYFSLCVGMMDDATFQPIYEDLVESFEGPPAGESEADLFIPERLVDLQQLFQGWDPKNTGSVPRDIVFLLARACEKHTGADASEVMQKVPEEVNRKDFLAACVMNKMHEFTDEQFTAVVGPLLEKRLD